MDTRAAGLTVGGGDAGATGRRRSAIRWRDAVGTFGRDAIATVDVIGTRGSEKKPVPVNLKERVVK